MRIGILGAPGVGKSSFARKLANRLGQTRPRFKIVDNYAPKLRKRTGLAYDMFGNCMDNVSVAVERQNVELAAFLENPNTITCGTILDTLTYTVVFGEQLRALDMYAYQEYYTRISTTMAFLGMMYTDLWTYDLGLLLPGEVASEYDVLQRHYITTIETMYAPVAVVPDIPEQIDFAEALIERYVEVDPVETTQTDEPGVRDGGEDGEPGGDPAVSLSDLLGQAD